MINVIVGGEVVAANNCTGGGGLLMVVVEDGGGGDVATLPWHARSSLHWLLGQRVSPDGWLVSWLVS